MAKFIPSMPQGFVQDEFDFEFSYNKQLWQDAIDSYIGYTHKSGEEATLRQAKNLLYYVAREMPQSRFKKGMPVARLSEYVGSPKVAGMIVAKHFKKKGQLVAKEKLHTYRGVTGRAWMQKGSRDRLKFAGWRKDDRKRYFTKEMAIKQNEKYRRVINSHFGFAQLIPLKALDRIRELAKEYGVNIGGVGRVVGNKPNKRFKGEDAVIKLTKIGSRIDMSIHSAYTFKSPTNLMGKPQTANAQFYDGAIRAALPKAMALAITDMQTYIMEKERQKNPMLGRTLEEIEFIRIGRAVRLGAKW